MNTEVSVEELARRFFDSRYNWAESTVLAVCQVLGVESDCIPRIATPFGGGMGRMGFTCGALSGAALAVGLVLGRRTPEEPRQPAYDATQSIVAQFVSQMGSALCRELTGFDLRDPEGYKRFRESGVHDRVCVPAVMLAARLAVEALEGRG